MKKKETRRYGPGDGTGATAGAGASADGRAPVWHRVFAGVLAALVIIGVIGYYYWIMRG